ncbi:hypothetical protein [Vibrio sp. SCSIO 43137]|uniref:hypothetical protein n=1 Tax=Vibrio sp. SCSIO 43137 TaxID=3021011 RepID=UPI0023071A6B|nr:hypothetical protein [Vibrio sp. SCSIO 43137]WCE30760.1 hypothetical protein PK654_05660 [Vibrio sp. SCSIO 43137]
MKTESKRLRQADKEQQFYQEFGSDDIFRFYAQLKAVAGCCAGLKSFSLKVLCSPTRLRSRRVKNLPEPS